MSGHIRGVLGIVVGGLLRTSASHESVAVAGPLDLLKDLTRVLFCLFRDIRVADRRVEMSEWTPMYSDIRGLT